MDVPTDMTGDIPLMRTLPVLAGFLAIMVPGMAFAETASMRTANESEIRQHLPGTSELKEAKNGYEYRDGNKNGYKINQWPGVRPVPQQEDRLRQREDRRQEVSDDRQKRRPNQILICGPGKISVPRQHHFAGEVSPSLSRTKSATRPEWFEPRLSSRRFSDVS